MNFNKRSTAPELMDDAELPEAELRLALKDLAVVNKYLGGNQITITALEGMITSQPDKKLWRVMDVGCGDGEVLRQIARHFKNLDYKIEFIGLDINEKSIARARKKSEGISHLTFSTQNILTLDAATAGCDIILCTLTMHHFTDQQICTFIKTFVQLASTGVIINDLQRSKIAYRLFQLFSGIFMKSKIAKYDGKVSIARAFKKEELETYSKQLALDSYSIQWKWAFRYLWVIKTI
ncbi:methyltransferase domain-containing protein [Dokdonia genika]|jgi:2-polyprenyl-3-methyl-5-hydroxy-6-metoxy-1,4-benzoquinol methylase|uniref:Methyltransferase domain-containing protein n=1 Tax=Dokdonia genika TaxID=308113 RepID=A0ABV9LAV7_9FLAO|nr:methyltransferase domain-containing protein [Dokdonia donghaensis]